jgi:Ca2+-binding EF-hand superfamily protein
MKIVDILDLDGDEIISLDEFYENLPTVLPILSLAGSEMERGLKKVFRDFDMDNSGFLEKLEIRLILNLTCDR